jgi:hypothetical protein
MCCGSLGARVGTVWEAAFAFGALIGRASIAARLLSNDMRMGITNALFRQAVTYRMTSEW